MEPKKPLIQVGMAIYESSGLRKIKSIPQGSLGPVGILELRYQKLCNTVLMMDVS